MSEVASAVQRRRKPPVLKRGLHLNLRCSCGSTLSGIVSAPMTDAIKMRDIFLSFHNEPGCVVTDTSEDRS